MGLGSFFSSAQAPPPKQNPVTYIHASEQSLTALPTPPPAATLAHTRSEDQEQRRGRKSPSSQPQPQDPMPLKICQSKKPTTTTTTPAQEKRHSYAASVKSTSSNKASKSKRMSFWSSSNPDDSEVENIPSVPALVRDDSSETASHSSIGSRGHSPNPATAKQSSNTRTFYRPKSAAKGFLNTTNGASETARKSYRKSFRLDEDAELVCLTEEQQVEWARLMHQEAERESRTAGHHRNNPGQQLGSVDKRDGSNEKFSNSQALAALEFGLRA